MNPQPKLNQLKLNQPKLNQDTEGATLLVTVMSVTVLIALLLAISTKMTLSAKTSALDRQHTVKAQYAAESGTSVAKRYLQDIETIFIGEKDATNNYVPLIQIPKGVTTSALYGLAQQYCGGNTWGFNGETNATGKSLQSCTVGTSTSSNQYDVLSNYVLLDKIPAALKSAIAKANNKTDSSTITKDDLKVFWNQVFSAQGFSATPPGANYTLNYRLQATKVIKISSTSYKFYLKTAEVKSIGTEGAAKRVILAGNTNSSEVWFQIELPNFLDNVLFTNRHRNKSGKMIYFATNVFDGPVHTNEKFAFLTDSTASFASTVESAGCYNFDASDNCVTNPDGTYMTQAGVTVGGTVSNTLTTVGPRLGNPPSTDVGVIDNPVASVAEVNSQVPASVSFLSTDNQPNWQAEYQPMPENANDQALAANTAGLIIPDQAKVTLVASTSATSVVSPSNYDSVNKKWTPAANYQFISFTDNAGVVTQYRSEAGGALYKEGTTAGTWNLVRSNFNGVLYSAGNGATGTDSSQYGNITIAGPATRDSSGNPLPALAGFSQLTIASLDNVSLATDLTYSDEPCKASASCANKATPQNVLGIYSQRGDVQIMPEAPNNIKIHSMLMASKGEVTVKDYQTSPDRGIATIVGGVIENYYGAFGTTGTTSATRSGYARNFSFDTRMSEDVGMSPPSFPISPKWKITTPRKGDERLSLLNVNWQQSN